MYTVTNYKTKKKFNADVRAGKEVRIYSPGQFPCKDDGTEFVEGPHYPAAHTWYAQVEMKNGLVIKVK